MTALRPRELFGVAVRILGVWFLTQSAYWMYWSVLKSLDMGLGAPTISSREDAGYGILYLILGLVLLGGASLMVWMAYGDAPKQSAAADTANDTPEPSD